MEQKIKIIKNQDLNDLTSHLLAFAVMNLYPQVKLGLNSFDEKEFFYDFLFLNNIKKDDLKKIETEMKKIIYQNYIFEKNIEKNEYHDQIFKKQLLEKYKKEEKNISFFEVKDKNILFQDFCHSINHLEAFNKIKNFKLLSISGAYWQNDVNQTQFIRIYGISRNSKKELNDYLKFIDELKERDHRHINKKMNIFMFSDLMAKGFPVWLEDGTIIKNKIEQYLKKMEKKYDFTEVQTPNFGSEILYRKSGHLSHYSDSMFKPIEMENEKLFLRPMTCPHHVIIYKNKLRSFRDLPLRYSEHAKLYRYETSGSLTGLERVRAMELTDAHIFARQDQISFEFKHSYSLIKEVLKKFDIKIDYISLSLRDPENKVKFLDDDLMWENSQNQLRQLLKDLNVKYKEVIGEAAFYGPKLDIQVKTALNHEITLSTLQLDFSLAHKFDVFYENQKGQKERPVVIHRGLVGTYERFISILLEQTKGNLPFWFAARQVQIIPIDNDLHLNYSKKIKKELEEHDLDVKIDDRQNERLNKKIRDGQISKFKYQFVIGTKEMENNKVTVRAYGSKIQKNLTIAEFLNLIK